MIKCAFNKLLFQTFRRRISGNKLDNLDLIVTKSAAEVLILNTIL